MFFKALFVLYGLDKAICASLCVRLLSGLPWKPGHLCGRLLLWISIIEYTSIFRTSFRLYRYGNF